MRIYVSLRDVDSQPREFQEFTVETATSCEVLTEEIVREALVEMDRQIQGEDPMEPEVLSCPIVLVPIPGNEYGYETVEIIAQCDRFPFHAILEIASYS